MSENNNWNKFSATSLLFPPCPSDDLVEVEYWDETYEVALAKDIFWAERPHASNKEVKEWRNLTSLTYSESELNYSKDVLEKLQNLFGFAPCGELASLIEEPLGEAIDKVELILENIKGRAQI